MDKFDEINVLKGTLRCRTCYAITIIDELVHKKTYFVHAHHHNKIGSPCPNNQAFDIRKIIRVD